MKKYILSASLGPYNYRYTIKSYTPEGKEYLLGGTNDLGEAINIAKRQSKEIYKSPWEDPEDKIARLQMVSIIDEDEGVAVKDEKLENYIWSLIDDLDMEVGKQ